MRLWVLLTFALASPLWAQPSGVTDARYAHLARGVDFDVWFQNYGGPPYSAGAADVTLLKTSGFTCIRLPVTPQYLLTHWVSATTIAANLANLDADIDLFLNAGIAVMLDFHANAEYVSYYWATPSAPQELVSTWQMLATRYANRNPELLFFEVMNEPTNQWTQAAWDAEQLQVLAAIRKIDTQHTVLVTPTSWSGLDALLAMTPYSDPNLIYVLHDYLPLTFTSQGATWVDPTTIAGLRNVPYPSYLPDLQTLINQTTDSGLLALLLPYQAQNWNADQINWNIQLVAAWAKKWGVRVVANEFGVYKPYSPPDSRARWLHDMTSAFEKYGIAWCMWDYQPGGFDLVLGDYGARIIDPNVAQALGIQPWTTTYAAPSGPTAAFSVTRTIQIGGAALGNVYAEGLVAADLNGDGAPDLVLTPISWPTLPDAPAQLFLNLGGGIMTPATFVGAPPTQQFVDVIVAGKFDRSGRLGVFLPDQGHGPTGGSGTQSKLILPASGNAFQDATANLPQQIAWTIGGAAGDVDGDGVDDLAVFYSGSGRLPMQILRNDGTGRFQADPQVLPVWVSNLSQSNNSFVCGVLVPRSGQSVSDLVAIGGAWAGGTGGRVFHNDGTGHFSDGAILPPPPPGSSSNSPVSGGCVAAADLNGDGNLDLVIGYVHAAANQPDYVQILINNGDGTFHDETDLRIGALPASQSGLRRISVVSINNGKAHALIMTLVGQPPLIFADKGDGIFRSVSAWNNPSVPWVVAGADLNGDGLMDLAFGEGGAGPTVQAEFGTAALVADGALPPAVKHPFFFSALDAAAFSPSVSPGEWMTIFGLNFLPAGSPNQTWSNFQGNVLPTSLGGMSVSVGGKAAAISFLSPTQANVQVPDVAAGDYVSIGVTTAQGTSYGSVFVGLATPSLFEFGKSAQYGLLPAATAADGTPISDPATVPGARPAHPGETIVLWGTGFGPTNPASTAGRLITAAPLASAATVVLNGRSITPDYAGLTAAGLNQINFRVPADMAPGSYRLQVIVATASTQTGVSLLVQ